MTQVSFSRVDLWRQCPFKYKCRYIDMIPMKPNNSPTNPLLLGSTLDIGIQKGYEEAEKYYWSQRYVATDEGYTELMKIAHWLPQLRNTYRNGSFQEMIDNDRLKGFIDYLEDDLLVDFKYSNNVEKYAESAQVHVYASELDPRPRYLAYVCVPKVYLKKGDDEDILDYRRRVMTELRTKEISTVYVDYDQEKVDAFWRDAETMLNATEFEPTPNDWCKYCEYKHLCKKPRRLKSRSMISIK